MTDKRPETTLPFNADITFQTGDIVFATDKRGGLLFWNREAEELFGRSSQEVLGKPYALACRMMPGDAGVDLSSVLAGRDFAGGVRCQGPTGEDRELYLFATVGRNKAGEPAGVVFVGRDVTGLWSREEAVRASTDKYRMLFENTLDSVAIADIHGQVLEANPACLRIYGYSADDVKKTNLVDVVAPESRVAAAEAMADLAQGRMVQKTLRMVRKDGTGFVVDLVALVVRVGGEKRILSVTRDATERAKAEVELKESESRYRAIFESVGDAVFLETVEGSILEANDNACRLLGYKRKELLALKVSDLVPPEARVWLPRVTDAILRDRTVRVEAVNLHKSGRQIPVEITVSAVELGDRTLVLTVARDITERKVAEQALRESEDRFRQLVDSSPDGIAVYQGGRVVIANSASARMLGYDSPDALVGRQASELVNPEDLAVVIERETALAGQLEGVGEGPLRVRLHHRDGTWVPTEVVGAMTTWHGAPAVQVMVREATARPKQ